MKSNVKLWILDFEFNPKFTIQNPKLSHGVA
jgi:hypothetical protein